MGFGDALRLLGVLFLQFSGPLCQDRCDSSDDGMVNIGDVVHLLAYLFTGGPAPTVPFPDCGGDGTQDGLSCMNAPCP